MLPKDMMGVSKPGRKWWRELKPPWRLGWMTQLLQALTVNEPLAVAMVSSTEEFAFVGVKSRLN